MISSTGVPAPCASQWMRAPALSTNGIAGSLTWPGERQLQHEAVAAGASGVAGDAAEADDQRQSGAAAAIWIGPVEHGRAGVEWPAGVTDRNLDRSMGQTQAQRDARPVRRAAVLHHVGDPLLDDDGQVIGRRRLEAR